MARDSVVSMLAASASDIGADEGAPEFARAVRLAAMAHATRDAATWGGLTYWGQLAARLRMATYRADTLPGWWEQMCQSMGCGQPYLAEDRRQLAADLAAGGPTELGLIGDATEALCLRVRLAWDLAREARATDAEEAPL